jgi:hypothetical protein
MVSIAKNSIKMSAITFTALRFNYYKTIESLLGRGVSITFLLLNPDSEFVPIQSSLFSQATDLRDQILNSRQSFCQLQSRYPKLVSIKTYDELAPRSIVIIDDACLKVEEHPIDSDAESRPNHATFKSTAPAFYELYALEYNRLEANSQAHNCHSSSAK